MDRFLEVFAHKAAYRWAESVVDEPNLFDGVLARHLSTIMTTQETEAGNPADMIPDRVYWRLMTSEEALEYTTGPYGVLARLLPNYVHMLHVGVAKNDALREGVAADPEVLRRIAVDPENMATFGNHFINRNLNVAGKMEARWSDPNFGAMQGNRTYDFRLQPTLEPQDGQRLLRFNTDFFMPPPTSEIDTGPTLACTAFTQGQQAHEEKSVGKTPGERLFVASVNWLADRGHCKPDQYYAAEAEFADVRARAIATCS